MCQDLLSTLYRLTQHFKRVHFFIYFFFFERGVLFTVVNQYITMTDALIP